MSVPWRARFTALAAVGVALLTLPLLVWQAVNAQRRIVRLPEARGARNGEIKGSGAPLDVVIAGDSTAVGVGVDSMTDSLAAQFATALNETTSRPVNWQTLGRSGARIRDVVEQLNAGQDPAPDWLIVTVGVNDTKGLTRLTDWQRGMERIADHDASRSPMTRLIVAGVPPMERFPALRPPLSTVLGLRARALDSVSRRCLAPLPQVVHVPVDGAQPPKFMAGDGFHPSAWGYRRWAEQLLAAANIGPLDE